MSQIVFDVNEIDQRAIEHAVNTSTNFAYKVLYLQAKADNVALHKGIRRLNNKIERLQGQLRMACEDIAHLQYQLDVEQGIEPPALGVPQRFIDAVLKEYQLLLKEENALDQS